MLTVLATLAASFVLPGGTPHRSASFGRMRCHPSPLLAGSADDIDPRNDDLYEILGAPVSATREELRRAYRRRARKLHPDVAGPESAAAFRRLVAAFEHLMDESMRSSYETQRKRNSARERANAQWEQSSRRYSSSSSASSSRRTTDRPAGSRRDAEAASREESERRRMRWREIAFEDIWREHMPLDSNLSVAQRTALRRLVGGPTRAPRVTRK